MKWKIDTTDSKLIRKMPDMEEPEPPPSVSTYGKYVDAFERDWHNYVGNFKIYKELLAASPTAIRQDNGEFESIQEKKGWLEEGVDLEIMQRPRKRVITDGKSEIVSQSPVALPIKAKDQDPPEDEKTELYKRAACFMENINFNNGTTWSQMKRIADEFFELGRLSSPNSINPQPGGNK